MNNAYITKISKFLPNHPVSNDEMEDYLGCVNGRRSRARRIILKNNGIRKRYYALDKNGRTTHTNARLTAEAIRKLGGNDFVLEDIDLLSCGTSTPDQLMPSHAAMVHGELDTCSAEIATAAGVCCSGMQALKYGYMSVLCGNSHNTVVTGSERASAFIRAQNFEEEARNLKELEENPILAFEKDFLRWMISDGAGALLLQDRPASVGLSLKIEWIEMVSYAHELKTCMYAGGDKLEDGNLHSWLDYDPQDWLHQSIFSIKQDVRLLNDNVVRLGVKTLADIVRSKKLDLEGIDYLLPHISSMFFYHRTYDEMVAANLRVPLEKWFTNLPEIGNVGSAAVILMIEALFYSGKLQKGERLLLFVPESARFNYAAALLTVV